MPHIPGHESSYSYGFTDPFEEFLTDTKSDFAENAPDYYLTQAKNIANLPVDVAANAMSGVLRSGQMSPEEIRMLPEATRRGLGEPRIKATISDIEELAQVVPIDDPLNIFSPLSGYPQGTNPNNQRVNELFEALGQERTGNVFKAREKEIEKAKKDVDKGNKALDFLSAIASPIVGLSNLLNVDSIPSLANVQLPSTPFSGVDLGYGGISTPPPAPPTGSGYLTEETLGFPRAVNAIGAPLNVVTSDFDYGFVGPNTPYVQPEIGVDELDNVITIGGITDPISRQQDSTVRNLAIAKQIRDRNLDASALAGMPISDLTQAPIYLSSESPSLINLGSQEVIEVDPQAPSDKPATPEATGIDFSGYSFDADTRKKTTAEKIADAVATGDADTQFPGTFITPDGTVHRYRDLKDGGTEWETEAGRLAWLATGAMNVEETTSSPTGETGGTITVAKPTEVTTTTAPTTTTDKTVTAPTIPAGTITPSGTNLFADPYEAGLSEAEQYRRYLLSGFPDATIGQRIAAQPTSLAGYVPTYGRYLLGTAGERFIPPEGLSPGGAFASYLRGQPRADLSQIRQEYANLAQALGAYGAAKDVSQLNQPIISYTAAFGTPGSDDLRGNILSATQAALGGSPVFRRSTLGNIYDAMEQQYGADVGARFADFVSRGFGVQGNLPTFSTSPVTTSTPITFQNSAYEDIYNKPNPVMSNPYGMFS